MRHGSITTKTCAYTNHTIMAEALEKWPIEIFSTSSSAYLSDRGGDQPPVCLKDPGGIIQTTSEKVRKMAIIYDGQVKMAHLAIVASYSVNGVARLHTEILKKQELK